MIVRTYVACRMLERKLKRKETVLKAAALEYALIVSAAAGIAIAAGAAISTKVQDAITAIVLPTA